MMSARVLTVSGLADDFLPAPNPNSPYLALPHMITCGVYFVHMYGLGLGHDLAHMKSFVCVYNALVQYIYMNAVWIHLKTNGIFVADML